MERPEYCSWCGNEPATEEHHLFRRSTSPEIINEPENKLWLGNKCHRFATDVKEFEELLQVYFFLKPREPRLTVSYVAESMRKADMLSPRDVARYRRYLAGEYSFISDRVIELEKKEPGQWDAIRQRADVTSDAQADRKYAITVEGSELRAYKRELKRLEKMMSALKQILEVMSNETRGFY